MNTKLLSILAATALSLGMISCANDDVTDAANGTQGTTGTEGKLTTFTASVEAPVTRTSLNYNTGKYFWEAGDKIWVLDDTNTWNQSTNSITGTGVDYFKFTVPGTYVASTSYKVVYHSSSTSDNQVEIAAAQTQETPNTTTHFGTAGDNGIATATGSGTEYGFRLDHKAAYLVFQPYTSNTTLQTNCYLTKIEVTADNNIAGTYTLNPTTNQLDGTGSSNQIVLTTKSSSGTYANGFSLNTASASVATNGAYMVIAPGTHKLKVRYWIKDYTTNVEGSITKNYPATNYAANNYYDLTANLKVKDYTAPYYMWDAQQPYWYGHEWDKTGYTAGTDQPTINGNSGSAWPSNPTDPRQQNYAYNGHDVETSASQNPLFTSLPNANEMSWYVKKGDPRWDGDELWTTMGHLYKGGMWLKKAAKIAADNSISTAYMKTIAADNSTDLRTTGTTFSNTSITNISSNPLSASDQANYFYLPALGFYAMGNLRYVGDGGFYWSSSAEPFQSGNAYVMSVESGSVFIGGNSRLIGYPFVPFE